MSVIRYLSTIVASALVSAILGYVVVAFSIFAAWDLMNVHDQDGGGHMAVGFVIAPAAALIAGIIGAAIAALKMSGKPLRAKGEQATKDRRVLLHIGLAVIGLIVGWKASNYAQYFLSYVWQDHIVFAIMYATSRYVIPVVFAGAGLLLARYLDRKHVVSAGSTEVQG